MNASERLRRKLVVELEKLGTIESRAVRNAFLTVRREDFLPLLAKSEGLEAVYKNDALVTKKDAFGIAVSSSSQPSIMAIMLEHLDLRPGHRVLEIGAGTGYNAALIKRLVGARGRVVAIDIDPSTAREARSNLHRNGSSVRVVSGDGRYGWPDGAPYDRIIATASVREVPRGWRRQLRSDGLIEVPLVVSRRSFLNQVVATFKRSGRDLVSVSVVPGGFMSMRPAADAAAELGPYVIVERHGVGPVKTIAGVTGEALIGLDDEHQRRLLSLALGRLRTQRLRARGDVSGLLTFLVLAGPPGRSLIGGSGLASRDANSLAFLRMRDGRFVMHSAGSDWAATRLRKLIERWQALGSPRLDDLRIRVTYGTSPPRAWRTFKRGSSYVSFDWAPT